MDQQQLDNFKNLLMEHKRNKQDILSSMRKHDEAEQNEFSPNELSNYDNHPADHGTELYILEMNKALKSHEVVQLKQIDDALRKISNGTFGQCEVCGERITEERLEILPYVKLCIDCEEERGKYRGQVLEDRPNEEKVLDAPFGRKYLNRREDDEYEGMDFLNDLMKYGSSDSPQDLGGYHDYEEFYTNEVDRQGIVDPVDKISNEMYKRQLPD